MLIWYHKGWYFIVKIWLNLDPWTFQENWNDLQFGMEGVKFNIGHIMNTNNFFLT